MPKEINCDITIIGAGLTGLVAAFYFTKAGKKVVLLEKDSHSGGVINTINEDGFVFEAGPNSGVLSHSEVFDLFDDLAPQCTLEKANKESKKRLIWKNGKWNALPGSPVEGISTPLFSLYDKFRILGEPFRKKGNNPDESVAELVLRRLGKSFLDYAVDPFISGIYAGDPNKIITRFALPKLYELEQNYGSFIKGAIKKKPAPLPEGAKKPTREVFSASNGLINLVHALENSIYKQNFFFNSENISVTPKDNSFATSFFQNGDDYTLNSEKVITTVGAYSLPSILPFIIKEQINQISNLEYAKVVQVALGFRKWNGIKLDAFGGLVPSVEKRKILGVLFTSSIFENRAPLGGAMLSVFMGGMRNPNAIDLSDNEIIKIVYTEINEMLGLQGAEPDLVRIFRYAHAIPQYGITSEARLNRIYMIQKQYPGLIIAGNIRDGIGMADRIKQAKTIADSITGR